MIFPLCQCPCFSSALCLFSFNLHSFTVQEFLLNTGTVLYLKGIHTRRQNEEDGCRWACFLKWLRKLYSPAFNVLGSKFFFYECSEAKITRNVNYTCVLSIKVRIKQCVWAIWLTNFHVYWRVSDTHRILPCIIPACYKVVPFYRMYSCHKEHENILHFTPLYCL
jgi:hypothetical protein